MLCISLILSKWHFRLFDFKHAGSLVGRAEDTVYTQTCSLSTYATAMHDDESSNPAPAESSAIIHSEVCKVYSREP